MWSKFLNKNNSFGKKCLGVEKSANNKRDLYGKNSLNHSATVFYTNPFTLRNFQDVYREFKYGMILKQATIKSKRNKSDEVVKTNADTGKKGTIKFYYLGISEKSSTLV